MKLLGTTTKKIVSRFQVKSEWVEVRVNLIHPNGSKASWSVEMKYPTDAAVAETIGVIDKMTNGCR